MSKVVDMPVRQNIARSPKSPGGAQADHDTKANFSYRLFLIVDLQAYGLMEWLRDSLEAPSLGDVVRQAVRAYALDWAKSGRRYDVYFPESDHPDPGGKFKRLNLRVPTRTKDRLDRIKQATGLSYTDVIRSGLGILERTAKEQEGILATLEGEIDRNVSDHDGVDDREDHQLSTDADSSSRTVFT